VSGARWRAARCDHVSRGSRSARVIEYPGRMLWWSGRTHSRRVQRGGECCRHERCIRAIKGPSPRWWTGPFCASSHGECHRRLISAGVGRCRRVPKTPVIQGESGPGRHPPAVTGTNENRTRNEVRLNTSSSGCSCTICWSSRDQGNGVRSWDDMVDPGVADRRPSG